MQNFINQQDYTKEWHILNDNFSCSLDSGKTISFKGPKNAVGEFVDVKVVDVKKSVIFGEIVSDTSNFKEKNISFPIEVSILPKGQKTMKLLRENKQTAKSINDKKSKK